MPPLYITEQGTKIRIRNNRVHVERDSDSTPETLWQAPIGTISQVVLSGNVGLTTPAIAAFLERRIDVVFLDSHGNFRGRLFSEADPHVSVRKGQYRAIENRGFVRLMVRCLVRGKIRNQKNLLQHIDHDKPGMVPAESIQKIIDTENSLESKTTINGMRGAEGKAAAAYFSGFRTILGMKWGFRRRRKNPSPDPVNAMLSFGYTLLSQLAVSAVQTVGLDAYAGFLHEDAYNRPSLGLDLVEEFRPLIDDMVLDLCESGRIFPENFEMDPDAGSCLMDTGTRKIFIQSFEERMETRYLHPELQKWVTLRQCMTEQARTIAALCEKAYELPEYRAMEFFNDQE